MPGAGAALTEADFDAALAAAGPPLLVDFWAEWCVPCRAVVPRIEDLSAAHPGRLALASVDVEAAPAVAQRYDVLTLPTLILFRSGTPVARLHGAVSARALAKAITPHLEDL